MTQEYDSDAQDEHSAELGRGSRWPRSRRRSVALAGVAACLVAATALVVLAGARQRGSGARLGADAAASASVAAEARLIEADSSRRARRDAL